MDGEKWLWRSFLLSCWSFINALCSCLATILWSNYSTISLLLPINDTICECCTNFFIFFLVQFKVIHILKNDFFFKEKEKNINRQKLKLTRLHSAIPNALSFGSSWNVASLHRKKVKSSPKNSSQQQLINPFYFYFYQKI